MNPEEIRLIVKAIAVAIVLGLAAAGGWTLEHWRTGAEIESLKAQRDRALDQGRVLASSVAACSAGVTAAQGAAAAAVKNGKDLLAEARRLHAGDQAAVGRIEQLLSQPEPAGADCNSAWAAIERQRGAKP